MQTHEKKIDESQLKNVSETLLIPLYFRAKETKRNGLIQDAVAVDIVQQLDYDFSKISKDWKTHIYTIVRTELLDKIVVESSNEVKSLVVVNLGAGLDSRHLRFENLKWYQLDLPEPMRIRRIFFNNKNEIKITKNIFDFTWIEDISEKENVLFIAEGLLYYLEEREVKLIFKHIGANFKNSLIAFDTIPKPSVKIKKYKSVNVEEAPPKWGNYKLREIEDWGYGYKCKNVYPILSKHILRWKGLTYLTIFPKFKNGFKVGVMSIN